MSLQVALDTLEAVVNDGAATVETRIRVARALVVQVRGARAGTPQAQTFDDLMAIATQVAQNNADPALRVEAAELLLLAEES